MASKPQHDSAGPILNRQSHRATAPGSRSRRRAPRLQPVATAPRDVRRELAARAETVYATTDPADRQNLFSAFLNWLDDRLSTRRVFRYVTGSRAHGISA